MLGKSSRTERKYKRLLNKIKSGSHEKRNEILDGLKGDYSDGALAVLKWLACYGDENKDSWRMDANEKSNARHMIVGFGGIKAIDAIIETAKFQKGYSHLYGGEVLELLKKQPDETVLNYYDKVPLCALRTLGDRKSSIAKEKVISEIQTYIKYSGITGSKNNNNSLPREHILEIVRYLGIVRCKRAVGQIAKVAKVKDIDMQHTAFVALGRIGSKKAKEILLGEITKEPVMSLREYGQLSTWGMSGCLKGLAFMYIGGHKDVLDAVKNVEFNPNKYTCGNDSLDEQELQRQALGIMIGDIK